jgi:Domain of unknown function (DUF4203)
MDLLKLFDIADITNILSGNFMDVISKYLMVAAIPVLIIALVNCFLGHKVFKILVGLAGVLIGGMLGVLVAMGVSMLTTKHLPSVSLLLIAAVIGAIIIGLGSFKLYKGGAFCMGFITGMILGMVIMKLMNKDEYIIAGVIGGLLMGLLAIDLYRHVVILLTSINGGIVSAACLFVILDKEDPLFILNVGIVLSVLGIVVQYILLFVSRKNAADDDNEEEEDKIEEKKSKKRLAAKNDKKTNKKIAKKDKNKGKRSDKHKKSKKYTKKKYNYQAEFFLVEIISNIAQSIKDFVVDKFGLDDEDEKEEDEEDDFYEDQEELLEGEDDIDGIKNEMKKDEMKSPSTKGVKPHVVIQEENVTQKTSEIKSDYELMKKVEEVNIPMFDLEDIEHKLEEELEHNLVVDKEQELEDLIIRETYRNLD